MVRDRLSVVCMKWAGASELAWRPRYGPLHVNTLRSMVSRHLHLPHEFVCITDDPEWLRPDIRAVRMWEHDSGGLYAKLRLFSAEMQGMVGPRFLYLDLDCVITGDITPLVDRPEPFVANSYKPPRPDRDQHLNTAMMLMDAGAHAEVWETFGPESEARIEEAVAANVTTPTDQGWVRLVLGKEVPVWTEADGTYEAFQATPHLPADARIVFFSGPRDPSTTDLPWIREHWR